MMRRTFARAGLLGALTLSLGLGACGDDENQQTILEILQTDARFSSLLVALEATGLDDALAAGDPVTLFAPSNDAFDLLEDGTLENLIADPDLLTSVLLYHVVPVPAVSTDLSDGQALQTLLTGASLTVTIAGTPTPSVFIDGATVTQADILATNGVIHVVGRVLSPPAAN